MRGRYRVKSYFVEDAVFIEYVKNSLSIAEVCRKLNIKASGGNYKTINRRIKELMLNTTHFTGSAWNVGGRYRNFTIKQDISEILIVDSKYSTSNGLKKRLYEEGFKEKKCEECGIEKWNDKEITLELDHVNGISNDNRIENLKILCPNCHSQTPTFRGKNIKPTNEKKKRIWENRRREGYEKGEITLIKKAYKCGCGNIINRRSKKCKPCDMVSQRKVKNRPSLEVILAEVSELGYSAVGRKYNVSDNCIRKWIKFMKIEKNE